LYVEAMVSAPSEQHGDVRRLVLDAAIAIIESDGAESLSMREVARRAGVSHQAPYHYFADRESILAALVCEGFETLSEDLRLANELAATLGVRAALVASAKAYVGFALAQPGVFRIMFRPDMCNPSRFPQLIAAATRAHEELDRLNVIAHGKKARSSSATILWSHVHGLACLLVDGPLRAQFATPRTLQAHLKAVADEFAEMVLTQSGRVSTAMPAARRAAPCPR
jgi:AcrR family transcriptional regulator